MKFAKEANPFNMLGYLFDHEEVLAETNGQKFLIENYTKALADDDSVGIISLLWRHQHGYFR